jgi:hypothetical protein
VLGSIRRVEQRLGSRVQTVVGDVEEDVTDLPADP